jgi:hypothetical protein
LAVVYIFHMFELVFFSSVGRITMATIHYRYLCLKNPLFKKKLKAQSLNIKGMFSASKNSHFVSIEVECP